MEIKTGQKHYFEYRDDSSANFWEIEVFGPVYTVRHGKIGTDGREQSTASDDGATALAKAQVLAVEMMAKGFREIAADSPASSVPSMLAPTINFSKTFRDYTSITALAYDYETPPRIGDVVEINKRFRGIAIEDGVVVHVSKTTGIPDIDEIIRRMGEWTVRKSEAEIKRFRSIVLDLRSDKDGKVSAISTVEFSKQVAPSYARRHTPRDGSCSIESGIQLQSGQVRATLHLKNGMPHLNGTALVAADESAIRSSRAVDEFNAVHMAETRVENVAWSDDIVGRDLLDALNESLDRMCAKEPRDFHPGSKRVVRDIVHPSLYCYVHGVSPVAKSLAKQYEKRRMTKVPYDFWGRYYETSQYQWLPAEFMVDDAGRARIDSIINNLDPNKYADVQEQVRRLFEQIFPLFETLCCSGALRNDFDGDKIRHRVGVGRDIPLRNRPLQIVTKIVEYRVNSEVEFDGVWHVEGMSHENILATGLCIIKRDENFDGACISFKRPFYEKEAEALMCGTPQNAYLPLEKAGGGHVRPLGTLETPAGRAMVFPNSHIHRLSNMNSADGQDAVRRIVVFWLVNPEQRIISTRDVEPQQGIMKRADAKKYRLALMNERKYHKGTFNDREVYLCEH